jgi:hypothetical protein
VTVPDLGDGGHADGVIQPTVAAARQPVDLCAVPDGTSIGALPLPVGHHYRAQREHVGGTLSR